MRRAQSSTLLGFFGRLRGGRGLRRRQAEGAVEAVFRVEVQPHAELVCARLMQSVAADFNVSLREMISLFDFLRAKSWVPKSSLTNLRLPIQAVSRPRG
ncbi:MAG: hypothetical protein EHM23_19830 [Acidobacteria bacterium]|nr:MAG: hypothetical protein EHM23_19830 [Acidobacteriota bacterium]